MKNLAIHHIGILVEQIDKTVTLLEKQGVQCIHTETFPEVGMKIAFTEYQGKHLEFLEVISPESPAADHKKGLHHLAFQVDDIQAFHAQLTVDQQFEVGAIRPGRHADIFFFEIRNFPGIQFECMQKPGLKSPIHEP